MDRFPGSVVVSAGLRARQVADLKLPIAIDENALPVGWLLAETFRVDSAEQTGLRLWIRSVWTWLVNIASHN